jgi:hypothetical protein
MIDMNSEKKNHPELVITKDLGGSTFWIGRTKYSEIRWRSWEGEMWHLFRVSICHKDTFGTTHLLADTSAQSQF